MRTNHLAFARVYSAVGRKATFALCLTLCTLGLALSASAQKKPSIITFDAPGAGTGAYQGTIANCINVWGAITGGFGNANGVAHGFLRMPEAR
jgi:hypothetical protein